MSITFTLTPIGRVASPRADLTDDHWGAVDAIISLERALFTQDAVAGLGAFSHLEVVYVFDQVDPAAVRTGARHPRGRRDWPAVGLFAQRAKARPNRLGVSRCQLLAVVGLELHVRGLDAIDRTPVLDVKPWFDEFGPRGEVRQPPWSHEVMADYW